MADFRIGGELKKANPESSEKKLAVGISLPLRLFFLSILAPVTAPDEKTRLLNSKKSTTYLSVVVDQWHVVVVVRALIWVSLFTLLLTSTHIRSFGTRQCRGGGDDGKIITSHGGAALMVGVG